MKEHEPEMESLIVVEQLLAGSKDEALRLLGFHIHVLCRRTEVESHALLAHSYLVHSIHGRACSHHLENAFRETHTCFIHLLVT